MNGRPYAIRRGDLVWLGLVLLVAAVLRLGMYRIEAEGGSSGLDAYDSEGTAAPWVDLPLESRGG